MATGNGSDEFHMYIQDNTSLCYQETEDFSSLKHDKNSEISGTHSQIIPTNEAGTPLGNSDYVRSEPTLAVRSPNPDYTSVTNGFKGVGTLIESYTEASDNGTALPWVNSDNFNKTPFVAMETSYKNDTQNNQHEILKGNHNGTSQFFQNDNVGLTRNLLRPNTANIENTSDARFMKILNLNKMIEKICENVLEKDKQTNNTHVETRTEYEDMQLQQTCTVKDERDSENVSEDTTSSIDLYSPTEMETVDHVSNQNTELLVPSVKTIIQQGNGRQNKFEDKYEYFSRNIEVFRTRGPMAARPRKKKQNLPFPGDLDKISESNQDEKGDSEHSDQEEFTKKGYAKPYECDICRRKFSQIGHLNRHMHIHTGEKPYKCEVCGKEFSQSGDKRRHERTHSTYRPYQCFICDREFNQTGHLQRHLGTHTEHIFYKENGEFDEELTRQKYQEAKIAAMDKTQKCPLCEKVFLKKYLLERHIRSHTGETPYKCDECGKAFTRKDRLFTHKRIHTGEKPYVCKVCGRGFNQGSHLKTHIRTHTGDRPYKCSVCGKGFAQSHDRKKHERIHTGERPYVCPLCGKDYNESSQLWKHARTHDDEQEEGTTFKCRSCDKEYEFCSQLIQHMKEHSLGQTGGFHVPIPDLSVNGTKVFQVPIPENPKIDTEIEAIRQTAEKLVKDTFGIADDFIKTEPLVE